MTVEGLYGTRFEIDTDEYQEGPVVTMDVVQSLQASDYPFDLEMAPLRLSLPSGGNATLWVALTLDQVRELVAALQSAIEPLHSANRSASDTSE